jgi:hypothetical protein
MIRVTYVRTAEGFYNVTKPDGVVLIHRGLPDENQLITLSEKSMFEALRKENPGLEFVERKQP